MKKIEVNSNLLPFVKWVGGKRNVIQNHLKKYLPLDFKRYIEPFVGGGAMFCYIKPIAAIINDINYELITCYEVIKNDEINLLRKIDEYTKNHSKNYFYKIRNINEEKNIDIAARFMYLNKTCFNGIYRVNSKGKFNVPFNGKKKEELKIYDKENIKNWNKFLNTNNIEIFNKNFSEILDMAEDGDFVYCDPPYDYEEGTTGFDSYNKDSFGQKNQILLANKLKELDKRNVKWMLSNHNTKLINELYKDFNIIKISTNRMINSNASKRINTGNEVVVINYEI